MKNKKRHGYGILYLKSGQCEEGYWTNNKGNGEMTIWSADGSKKQGHYENDGWAGEITFTLKNKKSYK